MLLKKQTVWLLTMLSLVVVLSVYYITSPDQNGSNLTAVEQKVKNQIDNQQGKSSTKSTAKTDASSGSTVVSSEDSSDPTFDTVRMELQDQRSQEIDQLQSIIASTDLPADKRSEAYDQMQKLNQAAQQEEVLETLIKAMGYDDALVEADGERVNVTVTSNKTHSAAAANDIIQLVKREVGDTNYVAVEFEPSN